MSICVGDEGSACSFGDESSASFPKDHPLSQKAALQKLIPVLRENAKVYRAKGLHYARKARRGEEIVHFHEVVRGKFIVADDTSWVIMTCFGETLGMSHLEFENRYDVDRPIEAESEHLKAKGFKRYQGKTSIFAINVCDTALAGTVFHPGMWYVTPSGQTEEITQGDVLTVTHPEEENFRVIPTLALEADWALVDFIPNQKDLAAVLTPLLKEHGVLYKQCAPDYARQGEPGEIITTVVEGQMRGQQTVHDDASWVIRSTGLSAETYVKSAHEFMMDYEMPGEELDPCSGDPAIKFLRGKGFKIYKSKKRILAKRLLDDEFQAHFPSGAWKNHQGEVSVASAGDFVAATYPDFKFIHILPSLSFHEKKFRVITGECHETQESMLEKFLPLAMQHGRPFRSYSCDFARPAKKGEEFASCVKGQLRALWKVQDDATWVVCANMQERHRYTMPDADFREQYIMDSVHTMHDVAKRDQALMDDGFKIYSSKKVIQAYQVTAEDLQGFLGLCRYSAGDEGEMRLFVGDFLCIPLPARKIIYSMDEDWFRQEYVSQEELDVPRAPASSPEFGGMIISPCEGLDAMVSFNAGTALATAIELTDFLTKNGVQTFCTGRYCPAHPGCDWQRATNLGVKYANVFIPLINIGWMRSQECQNETEVFFRLQKSEGGRSIIPVIFDDISSQERNDPLSVLFNLSTTQQVGKNSATWMEEVLGACRPEA